MNVFHIKNAFFVVPLKCGYTAFCHAYKKGIARGASITFEQPICAVARNPEARLLSFFQDKLRDNLDSAHIQRCQRAVMTGLRLKNVVDLKQVTIEEFLEWLNLQPINHWDPHLLPYSTHWFNGYKIAHLINLSLKPHSDWLFQALAIDRTNPVAYNKSSSRCSITISNEVLNFCRRHYHQDYSLLTDWRDRTDSLPILDNIGFTRR